MKQITERELQQLLGIHNEQRWHRVSDRCWRIERIGNEFFAEVIGPEGNILHRVGWTSYQKAEQDAIRNTRRLTSE